MSLIQYRIKNPDGSLGPWVPIETIKGEPGKDGITPHIGENGNWFIGEEDTDVKASGANEVSIKTEDGETLPAEIEIDLSDRNTPALVVAPKTAKVGQTIVIKEIDANGRPIKWEAVDASSGGGGSGEDGATFFPSVSDDGTLSWTNDKELPNPEPVNIKGPKGKDGTSPVKGTDYFTAADKAEMVNAVIAALPVYEGEVL